MAEKFPEQDTKGILRRTIFLFPMKNQTGDMFYRIAYRLGLTIIILWIIAKLLGFIHSPLWIELLPFIGVAITIWTVGMRFGRAEQKLEFVYHLTSKQDKHQEKMLQHVFRVEQLVQRLEKSYHAHLQRYH